MTTKTNTPTRAPQEEVVIEEPMTEASAELHEMVDKKVRNLIGMWRERKEEHTIRLESAGLVTTAGYKYWDCLLLGPYQRSYMDRPTKIIVANEPALMVGLIWINRDRATDGGVSGAEFLAGRPYSACFRAIEISSSLNVVSHTARGTFASLPNEFVPVYWSFQPKDPGDFPTMYEVHFAVDIAVSGLPFATFATWHWDPESDQSIPGWNVPLLMRWLYGASDVPDIPIDNPALQPHFDHDIPARFLVYKK